MLNVHTMQERVEKLATANFEFSHPMWTGVTRGAKTLIVNLLRKVPGFRWTAKQALKYCKTWQEGLEVSC
jgi:hypothetical protein